MSVEKVRKYFQENELEVPFQDRYRSVKIAILGYSGSGKSTLATFLGNRYHIPVLHLDTIQFLPGWKERDEEEAQTMVATFMDQDSWVIEGNYTDFLQKERLQRADRIIYLNFNRFTCLYRVIKRYLTYRNKERESMSKGCIEKLDPEFLWWVIHKGRDKAKKKHYAKVINQYRKKTVVLSNQKEMDAFMKEIKKRVIVTSN